MDLLTIGTNARGDLVEQGFAWIPGQAWSIDPRLEPDWHRLRADWDHLEPDQHLKNGATFRRRRYGRYYWSPASADLLPLRHEPYYQPEQENAYAGGLDRDFAPLLPDTARNLFVHALVRVTFACLPVASHRQGQTWEVRIHQIRIVATPQEPGLPAPEGIHQDGTDFLTLHLVRRHNVVGAESTIYNLQRHPIGQFTFRDPLDSLILEDPRILHGVTPVYPADGNSPGIRDLLGVDFLYRPDLPRPVESS
jgi:hypothetical protein